MLLNKRSLELNTNYYMQERLQPFFNFSTAGKGREGGVKTGLSTCSETGSWPGTSRMDQNARPNFS